MQTKILHPNQRALLLIEATMLSSHDITKKDLVNEINEIIKEAYE